MNTTDQTMFKSARGISFENLWKKFFHRELGKLTHGEWQYILGFNLAIMDVVLIGFACNASHFTFVIFNFGIRIRWKSIKYLRMPIPKSRKKVTLTTAKKRRK